MSLESYLYDKYIGELAGTLEEVLDAWRVGESIDEAKTLYDKARQILPKKKQDIDVFADDLTDYVLEKQNENRN